MQENDVDSFSKAFEGLEEVDIEINEADTR